MSITLTMGKGALPGCPRGLPRGGVSEVGEIAMQSQ